jgi:hypothetical protein
LRIQLRYEQLPAKYGPVAVGLAGNQSGTAPLDEARKDSGQERSLEAMCRRSFSTQSVSHCGLRTTCYSPNTQSTVALDWSRSSGLRRTLASELLMAPFGRTQHTPEAIATYCLPFTA